MPQSQRSPQKSLYMFCMIPIPGYSGKGKTTDTLKIGGCRGGAGVGNEQGSTGDFSSSEQTPRGRHLSLGICPNPGK